MITYAICIFLSAFLLFQIQPIISKTMLPWFGGTPAVWSSAMLFFQVLLTGGYAYSNWLARNRNSRKQTMIHLILMGASVCLVIFLWIIWPSPITPAERWKPFDLTHPVPNLFFLLTISIGLPFFVLSTNSPLMQAWFSHKYPGRSPYWLYALSNIGSLLGLIAYPIVVEPTFSIPWQGWIWTGGYILFVILAGYNAILTLKGTHTPLSVETKPAVEDGQKPKKWTQAMWILLSACASIMVLAVTNQITQEVAVIPFLWVLPLSIYILTFVLAFSGRRWYDRKIYSILLMIGTFGLISVTHNPLTNYIIQIIIYNFVLFAAAMTCHGELYALRPQASLLTRFYLLVSAGGAVGGLFVNFVAPYVFRGYWELYIGFAFVWILLSILANPRSGVRSDIRYGLIVRAIAGVIVILMIIFIIKSSGGNLFARRNFYGIVRVKQKEIETNQQAANFLAHGTTLHGFQFIDADLRDTPTSYYSTDSGVGLAILNNPHYGSGMRVGILGLGVGTLAAYGQTGDHYRFYEINPVIVELAEGQGDYFSFIKDSQATVEIVSGDARISLEKEINAGVENYFDILVLDTFSSDAIPVHLVTRQAFDLYLQNLAEDGLIAAHITNERLDLRPVFWQLAQFYNLNMAIIENPAEENNPAASQSTWVLLSRNAELLEIPALADSMNNEINFRTDIRLWTDEYSNLIQVLK